MKNVPKMISTKDLDYLSDIFTWNFNAAKKAYDYACTVKDEGISLAMEKVAKMHHTVCETILKILG